MFYFAMCVCCVQSGQPQDTRNDVKGKPERQKSKISRIFGQRLGKGAQTLVDDGVTENAKTASEPVGAVMKEQAEMDPTGDQSS